MNRSAAHELQTTAGTAVSAAVAAPPRLSAVMADTLGELVDGIAALDSMLATVTAMRAELIDQARQWSEVTEHASALSGDAGWSAETVARRVLVTELACALRMPERTVEGLVHESESLLHELPGTLRALHDGAISYRHAQSLIDHARSVPEEALEQFESAALPFAKTLTVSRFERKARVLRERAHPQTIAERHVAAVDDRRIELQPARDGMSWFSALLPAPSAQAIYDRATELAVGLQSPDEPRTLTQLRADVLTDLLVDGTTDAPGASADAVGARGAPGGLGHGIRARVLVTVPVLTLLGHSEEPGSLEGYGPIDADTARRLAAHAPSFTRILTHPETGCVLSVGRERYVVPQDLRTWLRVRDETCRFPGCARGAARCDLDHTLDWQHGGRTEHDNLAHLCPSHHKVKHHTAWTVTNARDGTLEWVSPTAHHYTTQPATSMRQATASFRPATDSSEEEPCAPQLPLTSPHS
ncbi:HNH endonuclease signature motif containing protein [Leifsonia sp. Root112D2]|uniref:HNH endonuclease signature motif containing protein n=1 Tax=Leifsonia sp. Root112D2 TaxID=1736426 RepID=UPI0006F4D65E|nr:HNH endonuclease signature motif containing protein [Leifsonia sp. Root112D2]KQV04944.1 hypothetical protein ASC63_14030 [Leifsonia sp. Root112D2]